MKILPGSLESASTGWTYSEVKLVGNYKVVGITVSNYVGTEIKTKEPAKIVVYDTPDAKQHGAQIKNGYIGGSNNQLCWTGRMPVTDGAIRGYVYHHASAQTNMWVMVE